MEIRQLQSFREVVRAGSFTAAAKALHMTQPAVSLHVKALEQEVGTRLMNRDARGVRLTAAGEALLQAADLALAVLDDGLRRIRELETPERGTLSLACGDTVALHLLPPVLRAFRDAHPQAEVSIRNHGSQRILELVLGREVDLGIVTRPPTLDPNLWARTLRVERLWLAVPKAHDLVGEDAVDLAALDGRPAVLLARPSETRALVDRGLRQANVAVEVVMESGNLEVVKAYVAEGTGLTLLPELAISASDPDRLCLRPLPESFPHRRLAVVRRKDRPPSALATDLLHLLAQRFRTGPRSPSEPGGEGAKPPPGRRR